MNETRIYAVEITLGEQQKTYSAQFQGDDQYAVAWKRVLTMAHGKGLVRCTCSGIGEKRLWIHSRSDSDRFHLARFPNTGPEHSEDCVYYGTDPGASGMGSYKKGVIEELDDGNTKIKLKVGLQQRLTKAPTDDATKAPAATAKASAGSSQSSMSLQGLLHHLWTQTGLHTWAPAMKGKRNLSVVHHHLMAAAMKTYAGRIKLSQNLLIGTVTPDGDHARLNRAKSLAAGNERRRLVVIAPLAKYQEGLEASSTLPIAGFHGIPHLVMSDPLWETAQRRFATELSAWGTGQMIVAIAQTDPPKRGIGAPRAEVVDAAFMWVTKDWMPVQSGFEAMVAEKLVEEGRRFEKPLRFDSHDEVFPDFLLKDTPERMPLEVWGMATPEYQTRKSEKIAHYDEKYGPSGWWSWNAAAGDPIPVLPVAAGLSRSLQDQQSEEHT